jgi:hypothetical protein
MLSRQREVMPLYYFFLCDGNLTEPCAEVFFEDDAAAKQEAILIAGDFALRQRVVRGRTKTMRGEIVVRQAEREIARVAVDRLVMRR